MGSPGSDSGGDPPTPDHSSVTGGDGVRHVSVSVASDGLHRRSADVKRDETREIRQVGPGATPERDGDSELLDRTRSERERERQWRLDHSQFAAARRDLSDDGRGSGRMSILRVSNADSAVSAYYQRQNEMIDGFSEMDALSERLLHPTAEEARAAAKTARGEHWAIQISNIANIVLFIAKVVASISSGSLSIIASTLDSLLDLLSGFILWYTARSMRRHNPYKYPIGKARMQPLGIIVFASIMATLGFQILLEGVRRLTDSSAPAGLGDKWQVYVAIMLFAIVVKTALYFYCRIFTGNDIVLAYAQDHFFDVVTNVMGLGAAILAGILAWWIDPVGAILLALYTMVNWGRTVLENVNSLTGRSAPPEFLQKITYLCWNHHEAILAIDTVRAYTFGTLYFTEVDVVLPRDMPLEETHDIGESLQNKLERPNAGAARDLDQVEKGWGTGRKGGGYVQLTRLDTGERLSAGTSGTASQPAASGGLGSPGLPPVWVDVSDKIKDDMQKIRGKMGELAKVQARALLPSFDTDDARGKKNEHERTMEVLTAEITRALKTCEQRLQQLSRKDATSAGNAAIARNVQRCMATDLQQLSMDFRKQTKQYLRRLQQQQQPQEKAVLGRAAAGGSTGRLHEASSSATQADEDDYFDPEFEERQLLRVRQMENVTAEREKEIQEIVQSVHDLAQIMKDISVLVIDQGTIVDRIDYNIQNISANVDKGVEELKKAEKSQKQSALIFCILVLVVAVLALFVILILKKLIF
ncbi:unnamed protein product [Closterium sp. Yama58-4]|nr:unnamed protein product [Closterium sp. Yama58-4]